MKKQEFMDSVMVVNENEKVMNGQQIAILLGLCAKANDNLEVVIDPKSFMKLVGCSTLTTYYKSLNPLIVDGWILELARSNRNKSVKYRLNVPTFNSVDENDANPTTDDIPWA